LAFVEWLHGNDASRMHEDAQLRRRLE